MSILTCGWVHSRLAFSMPSVMMPTITVPGRWSSGIASSRLPASMTRRAMESSSAVVPRGCSTRDGTSATGRSAYTSSYASSNCASVTRHSPGCLRCSPMKESKPPTVSSTIVLIDPERSSRKYRWVRFGFVIAVLLRVGCVSGGGSPRSEPHRRWWRGAGREWGVPALLDVVAGPFDAGRGDSALLGLVRREGAGARQPRADGVLAQPGQLAGGAQRLALDHGRRHRLVDRDREVLLGLAQAGESGGRVAGFGRVERLTGTLDCRTDGVVRRCCVAHASKVTAVTAATQELRCSTTRQS